MIRILNFCKNFLFLAYDSDHSISYSYIKSLFIYRILNTNDSVMKQLGRDLRTISEDFARSSERRRVMQQAAQVTTLHLVSIINLFLRLI